MGIISRLARQKAAQPAVQNTNTIPRGATRNLASMLRYGLPTWIRGDYTLRNSELLFAAVSRIANSLSAMPVRLFQKMTPVNSDLSDLVGFAPNPNMTSSQFFKTMEACRSTYGNCYALKSVDADFQTIRLDILDPSRVEPIFVQDTGEVWYRIRPKYGEAYFIHNFYVIHIPFLSTNGIVGLNPVSVLFDTLSYSEDIQKFSRDQLQRGINAAVVIEAPASLSPDQQRQAIEDLQQVSRDSGGSLLFLESGLKATALNLSPVDTKLLEVEKITRSKVAMVYGLPPHMLGDYSDTSYSSQEQATLEYLSLTMLPIVTAYEQELTKKLLTPDQRRRGQTFRFNMDAILRADAATMADVNTKAIRGGWKTPNEVRAETNIAPLREGSKLLAARDLTTLESIIENPSGVKGGAVSEQSSPSDSG